jgi:hypothetical protein
VSTPYTEINIYTIFVRLPLMSFSGSTKANCSAGPDEQSHALSLGHCIRYFEGLFSVKFWSTHIQLVLRLRKYGFILYRVGGTH